jgi:hypothetical protein
VNSFVPSINPIYTGYRRDKHSSYESFRANEKERSDITTAALFAPRGVRDARTGETAAAVAKAKAAAESEIQTSRAAAALFRGGPRSPGLSPGGGFETGDRDREPEMKPKPRVLPATPRFNRDSAGVDSSVAKRGDAETALETRESPGRRQRGDEVSRDEAAKAKAEGERAFAAGMAIGQIIVTAGYSGEIGVFENVGSPQWL